LNNNENVYSSGGSHWSLLVYFREGGIFYHFDSSNDINDLQAHKLASRLQHYFNKDAPVIFREGNALQQSNSYDCGIYLLCNVDNIASHFTNQHRLDNVGYISKEVVKLKRERLLHLISCLQKKATSALLH
jgi:sentrin-specific protease 8